MQSKSESNRASKRWQQEKNSVAVRASKMRRYELNSDEKRASKRESLAREFRTNGTVANVVNIVLLGNKLNMGITIFYRTIVYIVLHVHLYTSSHLFKKK